MSFREYLPVSIKQKPLALIAIIAAILLICFSSRIVAYRVAKDVVDVAYDVVDALY